jgi:hypothetical protein
MAAQSFARNHTDHSNDSGFQFEFFCDKCGNGHRSEYKRNNLGLAASLLKVVGSILGGSVQRAGYGADQLKDALRGPAWDSAFREAVEQCRPKFRQCTLCGKWVCPEVCWNHERGLCEGCAPNLAEHAPKLQADAALAAASEQVKKGDHLRGFDINAAPLAVPSTTSCSKCQARLAANARFCSECGAVQA